MIATTYSTYRSPVGELLLTGHASELTGLYVIEERHAPPIGPDWVADDAPFERVLTQLGEYFDGNRLVFDLPIKMTGTDFQKRVWNGLLQIPFGKTLSYGELAKRVGNPKGARAIGLANGRNPISIIVPCHRVIGANGSLTGYGGGMAAKRWLLDHEERFRG